MLRLHHRNSSWWTTIAFRSLALVLAVFTLGCGRFYLSDEVSRSPAVAAADNSASGPSTTATVWVEVVAPGFLGVVGKVFDDPNSVNADSTPLKSLSPPIPVTYLPGVSDPTEAVSGLDVVRIDGGFFVVWQLKGAALLTGGPTWRLFTDPALNPSGSPILLFDPSQLPAPAQARNELWAYYVYYRHRLVVLSDTLRLTYAIIDSQTHELLNVSELPDQMPYADVSYNDNPNRLPFMATYLSPEGDLTDPFRVSAAFIDFLDLDARYLSVRCRANVSATSSNDFNNTAGATHPSGNRYVVWDERDGDIFGTFVRDDCVAGPESFLGTRSIVGALGGQPSRRYFPMDVRFDSSGDGLVAMKQAIPSNLILSGITFVVSILSLEFDGLRISGGAVRPVGLPQRRGVPYSNRTFQLRSDFEAFKLVFDEVEIDEDRLPIPSTWRVLFNALDAVGDTIDAL